VPAAESKDATKVGAALPGQAIFRKHVTRFIAFNDE